VGGCFLALVALPSLASAAVPGDPVSRVQRTVGEAVAQVVAPSKPAPAPEPARAPAPAPRESSSAPAAKAAPAGPSAPSQTTSRAPAAPRAAGSSDHATRQAHSATSSSAPAKASGGEPAADPTSAPEGSTRPVVDDVSGLRDENPSTLPFTGFGIFPVLLVAVLALGAGVTLRRVSGA
jgi:cobalamin biosynthesis Mg chelatase CobN